MSKELSTPAIAEGAGETVTPEMVAAGAETIRETEGFGPEQQACLIYQAMRAKVVKPTRTDKLSFEEMAAISRTCGDA